MNRSQVGERGFVLVATLWVLVAMTLFVAYFSIIVADSQEQALEMKAQFQARLDQQATIETLLYFMSTRPMSYAGIRMERAAKRNLQNLMDGLNPHLPSGKEIKLDGRLYNGIGDTVFSIQDAGSLISLRGDNFTRLKKLLALEGLSSYAQTKLIATLLDYFDKDESASLDGAEYSQYESKNRIIPTNRFLVSPRQLANILEWRDFLNEDQFERILDQVSIYVGNKENYNTMTRRGMQTIDLETADIEEILAYRASSTFVSLSEVNLLTGSLIRSDPFVQPFYPSKNLRISIGQLGKEQVEWVGVSLTPSSAKRPWEIDYRLYKEDLNFGTNTSNAKSTIEDTATALLN